ELVGRAVGVPARRGHRAGAVDRDGHPRPARGGVRRPGRVPGRRPSGERAGLADGRPGAGANDEAGELAMRKITVRGLLARKLRLALTALAIVLCVTFVTGTLVLTDTLNRTFDTLVGTAYQHINFQVRGTAAFNNDTAAA